MFYGIFQTFFAHEINSNYHLTGTLKLDLILIDDFRLEYFVYK